MMPTELSATPWYVLHQRRIGLLIVLFFVALFLNRGRVADLFEPKRTRAREAVEEIRRLLKQGRGPASLARAEAAYREFPGSSILVAALAESCIACRNFTRAERLARRLCAEDPKAAEPHVLLGRALHGLERLDDARSSYEKALALDGRFTLASVLLVGLHCYEARWDEASAVCTKALHLAPESAELYNVRGMTRRGLGDVKGAEADFLEAVELRAGYAVAMENLAKLYRSQGDTGKMDLWRQRSIRVRRSQPADHPWEE